MWEAPITLTYAEALKDAQGKKGNRNEIEGKTIIGVKDVFRPDGGTRRRFQTLWFRTYRYVQVEIETADDPLRLHDLHGIFTAYPFQEQGQLRERAALDQGHVGDELARWRACARGRPTSTPPTTSNCSTSAIPGIQALISLYLTGDDRLVRQAHLALRPLANS